MNQTSKKHTGLVKQPMDGASYHRPSLSVNRLFPDQPLQIFDEFGNDITPLPMIAEDKRVQQGEKDNALDPSLLQSSSLQIFNQTFSRSNPSISNPFSETTSEKSDSRETKNESITTIKEVELESEEPPLEVNLDEEVSVTIAETEVYWLFDQQPYVMPDDDEFASYQIQRNADYENLCNSRQGNDRYVERGMNTMPNPTIVKVQQTSEITCADKAINASYYDLWDAAHNTEVEGEASKGGRTEHQNHPGLTSDIPTAISRSLIEQCNPPQLSDSIAENVFISDEMAQSDKTMTTTAAEMSSIESSSGVSSMSTNKSDASKKLEANDQVLLTLMKNMEKALNLNVYYEKYLMYKSVLLHRLFDQTQSSSSDDFELETAAAAASVLVETTEGGASARTSNPARQSDGVSPPPAPAPTANAADSQTAAETATVATTGEGARTSGANTEGAPTTGHEATDKTRRTAGAATKTVVLDTNPVQHGKGGKVAYTPPSLLQLWRFACVLTKGRNVSAMAFNPYKKDIIAVGYGSFEFEKQQSGLVCCWSLKKINFPQRHYSTPCGVTSVAWSSKNPNLLAVGLFNGAILIFDARKGSKNAIIDTTRAVGRHYAPVTSLAWVSREAGRTAGHVESLVSCSMDGRITEWYTLKGFDCADLMTLKRPRMKSQNGASKKKQIEALIARHAVGTALCFSDVDSNIYLVGTENGQIHRCSCSYAEQYLDTYSGHTSSVYALKYSPFLSDVFLSCSADWTIRLWHTERPKCYLSMATHSSAVNDLAWSHNNAAVFACTNEGNVEIWDLEKSTLDPVHIETVSTETTMSIVAFTADSNTLMVGDSLGSVYVYAMKSFPRAGSPSEEADRLNAILQSCLSSQVPT